MSDTTIMDILKSVLLPVLTGVVVWYVQSQIEALRRERERLHEQRRLVYLAVLEPYLRLLTGLKNAAEVSRAMNVVQSYDYRKINTELSMIADDKVISAFNDWMQMFYKSDDNNPVSPREFLDKYGELMLQIRKSVGNAKTSLKKRDMLASWITDIDQYYD